MYLFTGIGWAPRWSLPKDKLKSPSAVDKGRSVQHYDMVFVSGYVYWELDNYSSQILQLKQQQWNQKHVVN